MSTQCIAVFGTASIQRYIFQSNRLKENIGASYLAKYWFKGGLIAAIKQTGVPFDTTAWDAYREKPLISLTEAPAGTAKDVNLIYIGGGNAALLCKSREIANEVVKAWSCKLLEKAPGIRVAVGYGEVSDSLAGAYRAALKDLARCEETLPFGSTLYGLPVVRSCTTTGLPASVLSREENNENEWISQSAASKRKQVGSRDRPGDAQNVITEEFKSVLKEGQRFAIELDKLGGSEGQSHIAVVHADGNGIGELLMNVVNSASDETEFLHYIRAFSASISLLSQSALEKTLQYLQNALPRLKDTLSLKDEKIFPLRPIVYGGDDLTFVCDGRVGLDLAAYYLQEFAKGTIKVCDEDRPVSACAGVAIVPTKFPFARAYGFADELCGLAKSHRREKNKERNEETGSWLDFQIIQEGATRSIAALRNAQYLSLEGQTLHQRPYQIPEEWKNFVLILQEFRSQRWPRSRAKGLLQALTQGPTATKRFVEGAQWREMKLPHVEGIDANAVKDGWTGGDQTTPYFDPLEALDFYLEGLLATSSATSDGDDEKGGKE
jgi:hypothetical protein